MGNQEDSWKYEDGYGDPGVYNAAQIVGMYEDEHFLPKDERVTRWYLNDMGTYEVNKDVTKEQFYAAYEKALAWQKEQIKVKATEVREAPAEKNRLFVDMDGTLAVFQPVDTLETLYEPGYFLNLAPQTAVVDAVKEIQENHPEVEVFILSAYLSDSHYAKTEKNAWLDEYLPEIDTSHRLFLPCGTDKKLAVPDGVTEHDFLLDDYTMNLNDWEPPARGIKLLNGINNTKGTWRTNRLALSRSPEALVQGILDVMDGKLIRDLPPGREKQPPARKV